MTNINNSAHLGDVQAQKEGFGMGSYQHFVLGSYAWTFDWLCLVFSLKLSSALFAIQVMIHIDDPTSS